jgi:HK97 family phage major capsid protein
MLSDNALQAIKALSDQFPNLKSLLPEDAAGVSEGETEKEEVETKVKVKETSKMTEEKKQEVVEEQVDYQKALGEKDAQIDSLTKLVNETLEAMKSAPAIRDAGVYSDEGGKADPDHKSFGDFLLAIKRNDKTRLKSVYKAMGEDSGAAGGYLVPEEFHNRLLMVAENMGIIRPRATVIPVKSDSGKIPSLDQYTTPTAGSGETALAGGVTAGWAGEGSAGSATDAAFKQIEYNIKKIAGHTKVQNELIADSAQTVEAILVNVFGMAISALEEMAFLRGSGAGAPLGVLNAGCAVSVGATSSGKFQLIDALNMLQKFKSISGEGIWIAHRNLIPQFNNFSVATGGVDYVQPREGVPANLLGYPVLYSEHVPQVAHTGGGMPILIDPKSYVIFDRAQTSIAFSEHAGFTSDQGTWRFTKRLDGQPWLTDGITLADPDGSFKVSPIVYNAN